MSFSKPALSFINLSKHPRNSIHTQENCDESKRQRFRLSTGILTILLSNSRTFNREFLNAFCLTLIFPTTCSVLWPVRRW